MITAVQDNDVYIIRFQYDAELVKLVKNVPGRRYVPEHKYWTIPVARLGFLYNQLHGTPYESSFQVYSNEHISENASLDTTNEIPDIDLSGIPLYVQDGSHLFNHQLDFMKFAIDRQRRGLHSGFILADEMGLGKTVSVMNLALYNRQFNGVKHCLVIACINSAKYNWVYDIQKHTNGQEVPYLLGSRKRKNGTIDMEGSSAAKLEDLMCGHMYGDKNEPPLPYFLVMNIEAIRMRNGRSYPIRERLTTLLNKKYIGMVVLDEIHTNCSATALQGKSLLKLKRDVTAQVEWIPMTGTPIVNKPTDVFLPLKLIDGHTFKNYYSWCEKFCVYGGFGGYQIISYKNIPELKQLLQSNMIRRLKKDVLDLPPKIRTIEYVENTPYQDKLYDQVVRELISHRDEIISSVNPMVKLLKLRQVNGSPELVDDALGVDKDYLEKNAKMVRLIDLTRSIVDSGEKVVIFSNWVEPLRTIYKFLAKEYKVCCYTGTMKSEVREAHKKAFLEDPECKILMGTIGALGTSHTLTVAHNVIFYDLPWNQATVEQAEDRCHRAGTTNTVNIYSIITKDTVDERVYDIIMNKKGVSQYIVDNELSIKDNPQLFEFLLGYDNKNKKETNL